MSMTKKRVLFLCMGNSARSQMAEAILRKTASDYFEVFSAGLEPKGLHPATLQVMQEAGYDMSSHTSKSIDLFLGKANFDYLITVCGGAEEKCPYFPGVGKHLHWPFEDPAVFQGDPEEILNKFREVRDQIINKLNTWLEQWDTSANQYTFDIFSPL